MKSMFKKNAISGSVKPPFTAKNRRYRDCLLVLPTAARRSARSSGLRARISTRRLSRNTSTAEYFAASDMVGNPVGLLLCAHDFDGQRPSLQLRWFELWMYRVLTPQDMLQVGYVDPTSAAKTRPLGILA